MAKRALESVHCFRCVYSWRPRKIPVRICPRCKSRLWRVPRIYPKPLHPSGLGVQELIAPHLRGVRRLARQYGVSRLRVFGSVARGEATRTSDVDVLFESTAPLGLMTRAEFRAKLEVILVRPVDLCREESLKWYVRPQALADAVAL
ncbi:MAG: nucleotidyltransferase family protein [Thermoplasmata archaeon]